MAHFNDLSTRRTSYADDSPVSASFIHSARKAEGADFEWGKECRHLHPIQLFTLKVIQPLFSRPCNQYFHRTNEDTYDRAIPTAEEKREKGKQIIDQNATDFRKSKSEYDKSISLRFAVCVIRTLNLASVDTSHYSQSTE